MTYGLRDTATAGDFNLLTTGYANGTANTSAAALNTFWSVGNNNKGYGQASTPAAALSEAVTVGKWANLVTNTASAAVHQGSSITSVSAPVAGGTFVYLSAIPSNINTVFNNRLNAATQGTTSANTTTFVTTWQNAITATHTVSFTSGDAARYFFNAGGQLKITCSHPTGTGIDLLLNNLASNIGTVALSSPVAGSVTLSGTSYNGVTKIGGGGNAPTVASNNGYYALTTANANVFTQTASTGPAGYLSTLISINVKSNGTQGTNGDAGSVITVYTTWDEIPNNLVVSAGSATTLTICPPETTNIANTWGAITLSGTVAGN